MQDQINKLDKIDIVEQANNMSAYINATHGFGAPLTSGGSKRIFNK